MTTFATTPPSNYPIDIEVDPPTGERNRLTVAFRILLYIPHAIIVGGPLWLLTGFSFSGFGGDNDGFSFGANFGSSGVLGIAAGVLAVLAWFAIVFTGVFPRGFLSFMAMFMRWRARALSYAALLRDEYPPFGDGDGRYPVRFTLPEPPEIEERDRLSVGFRIILAIPHFILLFLLGIAWAITSVIAWFAILINGQYPAGLYTFAVGVLRWELRVDGYLLLLTDEYPPFSLQP